MPPPEDAPQDDESLDPEVARALNAACDALCNADNDYARLLAITNGVEALKNLGDDGSRAIERLRESAIKDFGMKAADVQIAIDQGVERTMVARATRRISGGRNQHNPHCDGAGSEGKRAADDLVSGTNVKKSGTRNRAGGKNTGVDEIWPDPDWSILEDRRGELPQFPSEKMPAGVQRWLTDAAHGAGVTPAHVAVPLLAVTAGVVGAARRIRASNSWSEPLTLWAAVIGLSGTGKTPGIDVSKRGLSSVERDRRGKIAELRRLHETASEAAMAAHKRWKDDVKNATESGKSPPPMPVEATKPEEFVAPRLWVSDATIERLAVLLRARPSGLLMICDELAGLFLNMGRYNAGHDHEFWLEAWNGKPFVVERMGRSPVEVEHLLIGIVGGFQPDKLVRSFERDDDGMYARMLFAWPEEPGYQKLTNNVDENDPAIHNAIARLVRLTDTPSGQVDAGFRSYRSFCSPKTVWLSPQAVEEFERFRQFIHEKKSELDGREREWLSKSGTHVLRPAPLHSWAGLGQAEKKSPPRYLFK